MPPNNSTQVAHVAHERGDTLAGHGRDGPDRLGLGLVLGEIPRVRRMPGRPQRRHLAPEERPHLGERRLVHGVDLVQNDELRLGGQFGRVRVEFGQDGAEVLQRLAAIVAGDVDHVKQQPAAFEVGQELHAQPHALARTLEQTRARRRR